MCLDAVTGLLLYANNSSCIYAAVCVSMCLDAVTGLLLYANNSSCIYAAVCAVVSVNIVIATFVYVAWNSEAEPRRTAVSAAKID